MNTEVKVVNPETVREIVKERYGAAARRVAQVAAKSNGESSACCGSMCCTPERDPITVDLYDERETAGLPVEAVLASLGCGNPTALARLAPGEVVLDLGSGGGIDVLLSARRVGPAGKAYGLDMTDDMLALARENRRKAGVENVEFLKGEIEAVPLPAAAVDVVISNCVINLAADKGKVLAEAFRVLRPGGRFAVSDIVLRGELPEPVRQSFVAWTGCVAGALQESEYRRLLAAAGFEEIEIEPTRIYEGKDVEPFLASAGLDASLAGQVDGKAMSAFVRARKPLARIQDSSSPS
ncbi:MAG: arsenite methyltransferase [Thermoanaerobaculia bacterium]